MNTLLSLTITLAPLVFGLAAWALAAVQLFSRIRCGWLFPASWCCCAVSLWFPLQAIYRWVEKEDIASILDCAGAYLFCATVLLAVNFLLFGIGFLVKRK